MELSIYFKRWICSFKRHFFGKRQPAKQFVRYGTDDLALIELRKLTVALIWEMQNYLALNDCFHTISSEFESFSHNFCSTAKLVYFLR